MKYYYKAKQKLCCINIYLSFSIARSCCPGLNNEAFTLDMGVVEFCVCVADLGWRRKFQHNSGGREIERERERERAAQHVRGQAQTSRRHFSLVTKNSTKPTQYLESCIYISINIYELKLQTRHTHLFATHKELETLSH